MNHVNNKDNNDINDNTNNTNHDTNKDNSRPAAPTTRRSTSWLRAGINKQVDTSNEFYRLPAVHISSTEMFYRLGSHRWNRDPRPQPQKLSKLLSLIRHSSS